MGNDGWHSFVALNDESASVDTSFDFTPVWNSMPAGASFCVVVPYSHGIAEEMLSHISQENDKLNGALDGAAGLCWYADSKLQTPLFVGQFDGTAEQAQLPGKLFTQNIGAHESKAPDLRFALLSLAYRQNTFWRFAFVRTNILRKQFPWQLRLFGSAIKLTRSEEQIGRAHV